MLLFKIHVHDDIFTCVEQLKDCRDILLAMKTQDGPNLQAMMAELTEGEPDVFKGQLITLHTRGRGQHPPLAECFQAVRENFIQEILDNLDSRFPQVALLDAMQVKLIIGLHAIFAGV